MVDVPKLEEAIDRYENRHPDALNPLIDPMAEAARAVVDAPTIEYHTKGALVMPFLENGKYALVRLEDTE